MQHSREKFRKCIKCRASVAQDPTISLHRFPKPGKTNSLRCLLWAKYCFPNDDWNSTKFQESMYNQHKVLCNNHFKNTCFIGQKLFKTAVPGEDEISFEKYCTKSPSTSSSYSQILESSRPIISPTPCTQGTSTNLFLDFSDLVKCYTNVFWSGDYISFVCRMQPASAPWTNNIHYIAGRGWMRKAGYVGQTCGGLLSAVDIDWLNKKKTMSL